MDQLNNVQAAQLPQLLHRVLDELSGRPVPVAANADERRVRATVGRYLSSAVSRELKRELLLEELQKQFGLQQPVAETVAEVLFSRSQEVRTAMSEHLSSIARSRLIDMDWRVQRVLAGGAAGEVKSATAVAQLQLVLQRDDSAQPARIALQMDKSQLDRLLAELAACQAHADALKV